MNGKTLKVAEYELKFGNKDRYVYVFGLFRYKPNNNLYVVYADTENNHNVVFYGSSHVKGNTILSMTCNQGKDLEIIKEYIFRVNKEDELDKFTMLSLEEIEEIEMISFNRLEIKKEVMKNLIQKMIPVKKEEVKEPEGGVTDKKVSKKHGNKLLLLVLFLVCISAFIYVYLSGKSSEEMVLKKIICTREYQHGEEEAMVLEEKSFNFNTQESLTDVEISLLFQFGKAETYSDFINKGRYYKYMTDDEENGGWSKDDTAYTFSVMSKDKVTKDYKEPVGYEEILSIYTRDGYTCDEDIVK